jgi:DNA end-binding protein Ku
MDTTNPHETKEILMSPRSLGNHPLQLGLVNCPVQMMTAIDNHDRRAAMFHHHLTDDTYSPVKMPKVCEGCGQTVASGDTVKGYAHEGQTVILTDDECKAIEADAGAAIEILRFVRAKQVNPMLFSGERCFYLTPDVDPKRGGKQAVATYLTIRHMLAEEDLVGVVSYTKWGRSRIALLRVEPTTYGGILVLQNLIWSDELREPEFAVLAKAKESDVDGRLLPVARSVIASMTEDWNPADYVDVYEARLTAAIEAKAAGRPVVVADVAHTPAPDDIEDLLAKLTQSAKAKAPTKAPAAKRAPAKKAPAKKAPAKKAARGAVAA